MKTTTKKQSINKNWVLKNKETGKVYSNWSYPSRTAARKAAQGQRFKGLYTVAKVTTAGDGGIDPKKLKKGKPAPMPKSAAQSVYSFNEFMNWLLGIEEAFTPDQEPIQIQESIPVMTSTKPRVSKPVNTTPKLRGSNSAPGRKFHRHGTFGVK